jgi:hypothetical protein
MRASLASFFTEEALLLGWCILPFQCPACSAYIYWFYSRRLHWARCAERQVTKDVKKQIKCSQLLRLSQGLRIIKDLLFVANCSQTAGPSSNYWHCAETNGLGTFTLSYTVLHRLTPCPCSQEVFTYLHRSFHGNSDVKYYLKHYLPSKPSIITWPRRYWLQIRILIEGFWKPFPGFVTPSHIFCTQKCHRSPTQP